MTERASEGHVCGYMTYYALFVWLPTLSRHYLHTTMMRVVSLDDVLRALLASGARVALPGTLPVPVVAGAVVAVLAVVTGCVVNTEIGVVVSGAVEGVTAPVVVHGLVLHVTTSISFGGHVPELLAGSSGRWRNRMPPPQDAEHTQSLG